MIALPEPRMIQCGEIELEVFEAGQGGIPVVLAHGWPEHAFSWRHQMRELAAAGYHVIVPNQRGYGNSSSPAAIEAYDCFALTSDFNHLLDALDIDRAVFVGHDWGAILVWYHAMLNPDRVAGVANLSVPFQPRAPSDPVAFWEKRLPPDFYIVHFNRQPGVAASAFEANPRRVLTNLYRTKQWLDSEEQHPNPMTIVHLADVEVSAGELLLSEEELNVFLEAFQHSGFHGPCNWYCNWTRNWELTTDVEEKVHQPALMIYGRYDGAGEIDMTGYVDDLESHHLECGHWIQQEKPEETNRILLDWLDRRMKPLFFR